jgi:uncharacterized membrane protein YgdD (TMEM256/DUF423 family)
MKHRLNTDDVLAHPVLVMSDAVESEMHGRGWIAVGAILGGLAVVCGAFAAHGLDSRFAEWYAGETRVVAGQEVPRAVKYLADFRTGAEYQMYHALALVAVGLSLSRVGPRRSFTVAAWSFLIGCLLFSGSLYVLTLTGQGWLGAITPLGGVAFIVGWAAMACTGFAGHPLKSPSH